MTKADSAVWLAYTLPGAEPVVVVCQSERSNANAHGDVKSAPPVGASAAAGGRGADPIAESGEVLASRN